uniref:CWF19-like protein 2 n=1 Tax=Salarias fasciatus TaxID=181472 RepID=A0A672FEF7_SALFA
MAASGVSFESSCSIDERKANKRQARQEALEKAKHEYEKEERKKQLKRQRGEDTWMLPEVNDRLQQIQEEGSDKSKKKKDKKSKKKKKKAKKEKKTSETGDGSNDSSEVMLSFFMCSSLLLFFVCDVFAFDFQRDEWMTFDFLAMKTTSTSERRAEKERQKEEERAKAQAIEQAGLHKLELNPYWKDGGTGLPPEEMAGTAVKKGSIVNDGGLSWLKKSYQRMKEQAEREQRSLNDVVSERYGSMEEFQQRLAEAEKAVYGERRGGDGTARGGWRRGEETRWRRKEEDTEDRDRWRRNERERDSPSRDRERRHAGREEEREKERHRDRERDGREGQRERERDGDRQKERSRHRDEDRSRRFLKPTEDEDSHEGVFLSHHPITFLSQDFLQMHKKNEMCFCTDVINKPKYDVDLFQVAGRSSDEQEVLLFRTDQSGRAWPVNAPSGPQEPHGGRRKKKPIETHVDGERVRYFQDDDGIGLQEMVRREKMSSAQDQNALYSRMAAKMMGKTDGENYTLDDMFVSSAAQREGEGREEERMRSRAIGESRRLAASMEKCQHCFSSSELQKHLIVAIGSKVYLSLPAGVSMTEGHCLICPLQHHCSATGLDEDVWSEMQLFRRTLVRMFESQELDCVFMETHMNPRRRHHMVLECIPLPKELGDMAPIYFKKAIMECDEEWAMNKKVVDLSSKDIRKAVPRGLPYFAVDFGLQGGYAHVIENEQKFPRYFGKEVVGGMMDLEPRRWRKTIRENFDDQRKKVLQFSLWWKPYDCTKTEA